MLLFFGIPLAVVFGDGALKSCARRKLSDGRTKRLAKGHILLRLFCNPGVALGIFKKHPRAVLAVHGGLLCATAGASVCLFGHPGKTAAKTGLALMLGGGAGNFLDRLRQGFVTDYVSFDFGPRFARLKKIVFNCSDFCVFAGAVLLVLGVEEL